MQCWKKAFKWVAWLPLWVAVSVSSGEPCDKTWLSQNLQYALPCYVQEPENIEQPLVLNEQKKLLFIPVTLEEYTLSSQYWPKASMQDKSGPAQEKLWQHTLTIYRPNRLESDQAILWVGNGTRWESSPYKRDIIEENAMALIAAQTHSVVVLLRDVPNQYLAFQDGVLRKEDGIVAYTWRRFMDDPQNGAYWPLHIPMSKAVVKAMDAVQQVVGSGDDQPVKSFLLMGASKRGWATWLTALIDDRVSAIVPVVIDVLNMEAVLSHILHALGHWPLAFHDYVEQHVSDDFGTPQFTALTFMSDPMSYVSPQYWQGADLAHYRERLSIPKMIVSASSDEFFGPDSAQFYLNDLPGETHFRTVPNSSHYIAEAEPVESLLAFKQKLDQNIPRPQLTFEVDALKTHLHVETDQVPKEVWIWEADNPKAEDFGLRTTGVRYHSRVLTGVCSSEQRCQYDVDLEPPAQGFRSVFVETIFQDQGFPFKLSTVPVVIAAAPAS